MTEAPVVWRRLPCKARKAPAATRQSPQRSPAAAPQQARARTRGTKPGSGSLLTISPSGLFNMNPDANGKYLYETRPQFANLGDWTSSDFLFTALGVDPALMQKRLGDGYYEQRLVREQMNDLTGRAPANGASDDIVYQALLGNAVSAARAFGLRPGIALTAEQVSHLTSDIVWMESQQANAWCQVPNAWCQVELVRVLRTSK